MIKFTCSTMRCTSVQVPFLTYHEAINELSLCTVPAAAFKMNMLHVIR